MAVPNFLSSDSGLQTLHSALRFRSFTPPDGCVYGDKEAASSMVTKNVILSALSLSSKGASAKNLLHTEVPVILSEAKNLYRRPFETAAFDMEPVRRGVAGLTPLRIKQQFSTKISAPRLFPFVYADGNSIHPDRGRWRTGDMLR